ncbi:MAG: glycosyltransferase family 2 protein [Candidatus Obscuribacterales bacterium]|nr:glycosyltransferase family 2 protein [Candidatus Obscuribacterales bacterium]
MKVLGRMSEIDLSVVVAVYNEHPANLVKLLERLYQVLSPLCIAYEVVFVNDGSRAETSKALQQLACDVTNVKLVSLSRNFGQQAAISAGLDHCDGRAIVNIDSDLQDPPELIPEMLKYWRAGYDVVYAQRSSRRDRLSKRLSAFLFYRVLTAMSSVNIPWDTGDFRLMDRRVLSALNQLPEKTRFLRGQIPWLGFKQIGISIDRGAREVGESTYTLKKLLQLAMDGLLAFSSAPLFLISTVGATVLGLGLLGFLACLVGKIGAPFVLDNTMLLSLVAAFAGLQIMAIGLVAVYLAKVLDEVRARPTYIVGELYKGGKRYPVENRGLTLSAESDERAEYMPIAALGSSEQIKEAALLATSGVTNAETR